MTEFKCTSPEEEGISSRVIYDFLHETEKVESELHGMIILRHGKKIFEAYNEPYRADIPHIMHSFTKIMTNMAVGRAYTENYFKLDDPILKYLPEYAEGASEYLQRATIRNLITMRSGHARSIGGNEWRPLKTSWVDAYFKVPFDKEPGETYMYSSGNSYVLSYIVQRVTGKTCQDYLRPVTEKLGLSDYPWMKSPEGVCSGGNGILFTTEDMAKIGQLYLNRGKWEGEQLLSEEWTDLSFGRIDEIAPVNGEQYHFHWFNKDTSKDIYAAMGMFGQVCAVIPSLDMVVAYTSADETYNVLKTMQKYLVDPSKEEQTSTEKDKELLLKKASCMTLEGKHTSKEHVQVNKDYLFTLDGSVDNITGVSIHFDDDAVTYIMKDAKGTHSVTAGLDHWIHGTTSMTGAYLHHQYELDEAMISACAYWQDDHTLMMEWRFPQMAFFDHVTLTFDSEAIRVNRWVNMNSQDLRRPELTLKF